MSVEIRGCIDKMRFQNGDFIVALFKVEDGRSVVIKGDIPGATVGLAYLIEAEEFKDERFGLTFKVVVATPDLPTSEDAIEQYLRDLPGIGPSLASKIIKAYGKESIAKLIEAPGTSSKEIKGLSIKKATEIGERLSARKEEADNVVKLRTLLRTAPPHVVKKAIKKWGQNARVIVEKNPYDLIKLPGVGFKIADGVALEIGVKPDSDIRLVEALLFTIKERRQAGHTKHGFRAMTLVAQNICNAGDTRERIAVLAQEDARITAWEGADTMQLTADHEDENEIAAFMIERVEHEQAEVTLDVPEGLGIDQAEAFLLMHQNPKIFILSGAPGTGKTHLMRSVIENNHGAILLAPTGKAAKRLAIATGQEAMTIHRALGVNKEGADDGEWSFKHGKDNPIAASMVVVDEFSMVDLHLSRQLFDAISPGTDLLIVGDDNQLPSVGCGAVLRDLIESGVPGFELTEIKRQDPGAIIQTCHLLKDNQPPRADLMNVNDLLLKQVQGPPEMMRDALLHAYFVGIPAMLQAKHPERFAGIDDVEKVKLFVENIQILSPYKTAGEVCTQKLNKLIREELFDLGVLTELGKYRFACGDRIIQTKNDYDIGAYNGDTGTVSNARKDPKQLGEDTWYFEVKWDANDEADTWVPVGKNNMDWAYAITVHKSQGSEWPIVLVPLASGSFFGRQLFYTAISRAKSICALVGHFGNLQLIAANNNSALRETSLQQKIEGWTDSVRRDA